MRRLRVPRLGWRPRASMLVALGLTWACAGGGAPEEGTESASQVEQTALGEEAQDSLTGALRRFLPDAMRRDTRAETFPHDAHVEIDCAVCHQVAEGHGSHDTVECADCHRASALATLRDLGPDECAACHHGAEQALACSDCHESAGTLESEQMLAFEVWTAPRSRTLGFDHALHGELECADCHTAAPALAPAESCASCHEEHHAPTVRCAACHTPAPEAAHDVQSHLTCSGSGCHRAPDVEAIADTRAVCLVCHQDQEEHEPEGECIECHRVRPGLGGGLDP